MKLVFDADILSTLIKTSKQKLIPQLFPKAKVIIPQKVRAELEKGYFRGKKLAQALNIQNSIIKPAEEKAVKRLEIKEKKIHSGERQAMALAQEHNGIFLSNDKVALQVAKKLNIKTKSLREILLTIAERKVLTKEEMEKFLSDIETKDYTVIIGQEEILAKYGE